MQVEEYKNAVEKLEFGQILEMTASFAQSKNSKSKILSLSLLNDEKVIERSQSEIEELCRLNDRGETIPISGWKDSSDVLRRLSTEGLMLSCEELVIVASAEKYAEEVKKFLSSRTEVLTIVSDYSEGLSINENVIKEITSAVGDDFTVVDRASPRLSRIRNEIYRIRKHLREGFNRFISEVGKGGGYEFVTLRGERYVVSMPISDARKVNGVIHESSASGASLFIEPLEFVEDNNRLERLLNEEKQEVDKILRELTDLVYRSRDSLLANQNILITLDVLSAKLKLALRFRCVKPMHSTDGRMVLRGARHPLLEMRFSASGDDGEVVPLDIDFGSDLKVVVISGPNAGGKTVALKTIGLAVLMDRVGLLVPCMEDTIIPAYRSVLVDIGDNQSIENSLSTFSSRIEGLKTILESTDIDSLVLIDEIGDGTDPIEGAAIAEAVLEKLAGNTGRVIVTTHLSSLKGWAHTTPYAENATMEFDVEDLEPLYRFRLGVPGRSWGIDMAWRLGLDKGIVETARSRMESEHVRLEQLIAHLEETERILEEEMSGVRDKEKRLDELTAKFEEKLDELKQNREFLVDEAKRKALEIVTSTRREMERLVKEIRTTRAEHESVKKAKKKMDRLAKDLSSSLVRKEKGPELRREDVGIGMWLYVKSLNKDGKVTSVSDTGRVFLELDGGLKVETSMEDLSFSSREHDLAKKARSVWSIEADSQISDTLMIRGMERMEALELVDKFIDRAVLSGLNRVVIIHGKGKGILKRAVYDMLRTDSRVADIHPGEPTRGGDGFAVVELK
ncbi:MAG: hypothetical protein B6D63_02045 [Candidatus Latescibacteria bacterium 4484_7]|nr:MAG: hypothetical protein B6D63_02045 [Candidatus Latescibacteria bacterium 4484_7]